MITMEEVKSILLQMESEKGMPPDSVLLEDVCCIVFRIELFLCGKDKLVSKHIDIEFVYGDYCELHEEEATYQAIISLCNLQAIEADDEVEIILYQR